MENILSKIQGGLIVSCQAQIGEPLHGSEYMAKMAVAARIGGAHAIRAESPMDIAAIRKVVDVPIVGLYKYSYPGFAPYITPTFLEAQAIALSGADIIAIDGTFRSRPRETLETLIAMIHDELQSPVMVDISTVSEAVQALGFGADIVATTLRGHTENTSKLGGPEPGFIEELVMNVNCPVVAEGNIRTPEEARKLLDAGAFAVVVGSAITRPQEVTRWFISEITGRGLSK